MDKQSLQLRLNQKIIIQSLSMDLKRVALGFHRGSNAMAERFKEEAIKRIKELEVQSGTPYLNKLLKQNTISFQKDNERLSEDALMFSTLYQNYSQTL